MNRPGTPKWHVLLPGAVILWVVLSWPAGYVARPDRLSRPGELEYLVADVAVLLPLALAAFVLGRRGSAAAPVALTALMGALAYGVVHFAVRTAREQGGILRIGFVAGVLLLLLILTLILRRLATPRARGEDRGS